VAILDFLWWVILFLFHIHVICVVLHTGLSACFVNFIVWKSTASEWQTHENEYRNVDHIAGFEVLSAVKLSDPVEAHRVLGETYFLHLQGERNKK
jgi:hypothetical protein